VRVYHALSASDLWVSLLCASGVDFKRLLDQLWVHSGSLMNSCSPRLHRTVLTPVLFGFLDCTLPAATRLLVEPGFCQRFHGNTVKLLPHIQNGLRRPHDEIPLYRASHLKMAPNLWLGALTRSILKIKVAHSGRHLLRSLHRPDQSRTVCRSPCGTRRCPTAVRGCRC
jgi:hypothetical protein